MLAVIGSIIGILSSLLPEFVKAWNKKQDNAHETEMYKLQVESMKFQHQFKMAEIEAEADIRESEALYKASEIKLTGWKFIDAIIMLYQSSVRPTITYLFMAFYIAAKYGQWEYLMLQTGNVSEAIWKIFNSEDMALFSTIMGYWFGQRMIRYAMGRIGGGGVNVPTALRVKK